MIVSALGGLTGLLTAALPEVIQYFQRAQEHEFEMERLNFSLEADRVKARQRMAEADLAVDREQMIGVYDHAKSQPTTTWVDQANAAIRPVITGMFVLMFFSIIFAIITQSMQMGANLNGSLIAVLPMIEGYLSAILCFWFGARQIGHNKRQFKQ